MEWCQPTQIDSPSQTSYSFTRRRLKRVAVFAAAAILLSSPATHASEDQFAFTVRITLSPKAAATLTQTSEGIIVSAAYSGDPIPSAVKHADEIGQINLGLENVEVPGKPATVQVTGTKIYRNHVPWIKGPILLNVNVYSARRSGPDNILACDFFDGTLQQAVRQSLSLHCSLIAENAPTQHKP
jgi:hypothetical protein